MAAIFSHAETDHLAGVPLPAAPAARPAVIVPRGPRGLWDAMAKATGARPEVPTPATIAAAAAVPPADDAHLAYLARLGGSVLPAAAPGEAEVIDLAAERARRRR